MNDPIWEALAKEHARQELEEFLENDGFVELNGDEFGYDEF
jgi:hypothetical protein